VQGILKVEIESAEVESGKAVGVGVLLDLFVSGDKEAAEEAGGKGKRLLG